MIRKLVSKTAVFGAVGLASTTLLDVHEVLGQTFLQTEGAHFWNDDANWGQAFPNGAGATATLPAPTAPLTIDLGQPISLDTLTINKATTVADANRTTLLGSAANTLTFVGVATITNSYSSEGTGHTYIEAPVIFDSTLTISQLDNDPIRFIQPLSGAGGVLLNRDNNGEGTIRFAAANSYAGATSLVGSGQTRYVTLRLDHDGAVPGGIGATGGTSNLSLGNSSVIALGSNDFHRSIGTGPDQIQFNGSGLNGFAAFGADRVVNFGGAGAPVSWAAATFGNLTFSIPSATHTVELQNPLDLGASARTIRVNEGSAAIDGRITAPITSTGTANLTKAGAGTLSLAAANSYTGRTIINNGALRLDHPQALPASSNVTLTNGGLLHLAAGDYAATLGTGNGQLRFVVTDDNGNGGFAASGGVRQVTLNGGAQLTWGSGNFATANFILSDDAVADGTVNFTNPINLAGAQRTFAVRDGLASRDAILSGVISGAGPDSIFYKSQNGTVELTAANTYEGPTRLNNGVVLLGNANAIPGGINGGNIANIQFTGNAIVGLGVGDFTSGVGTGAGQVYFAADKNAGFAAYGGNRAVNLGGASEQVVWNSGFVSGNFLLSSEQADGTIEFQNPIDLNGAPRTAAVRNGTTAIDGVISGVISGSAEASLSKTFGGTLALTAANTYEGGTNIVTGRLLANNTSGSAVGSGDVTVNSGATLGGTGFVGTLADASNVSVQSGGRINPGVEIGELTVSGDVTFSSGSFLDIDLNASSFDKLTVNGLATLGGALNIVVPEGFSTTPGSTYSILTATGGLSGTFSDVTWNGATLWSVQYGANSATLVAGTSAAVFAADFNGDGAVDGADLLRWKENFGLASGATKSLGDANGDGVVDGSDFLAWQRELGSGVVAPAAGAAAAVPEPAGLGLLLAASVASFPFLRKFIHPHAVRGERQPRA